MSRGPRLLCALSFGIACVALPSSASAEEKYEQVFAKGRAAMEAHDYERACSLFKDSLDLGAPVGALLNLADCQDKRGHLSESLALWRQGIAKLPPDDPRRDIAVRAIDDVGRRVGRVALVWTGAPPGVRAFVDTTQATVGGDPTPVDAGSHRVTITDQDGTRTIDVAVLSGELKTVDVAAAGQSSGGMNGLKLGGIIAFAVGGAGALGAAVSGGLYLSDRAKANDGNCTTSGEVRVCPTAEYNAGQSARSAGIANVAMFVTAGVGLGTGTILFILGSRKHPSASAQSADLQWKFSGNGLFLEGKF